MDLRDGVVIDLGVVDGLLLDSSLNGVWCDNESLLGDWNNLWLSWWCGLLSFFVRIYLCYRSSHPIQT